MKSIKIERLSLENFKCHKALELDFSCRSAALFGDNGAGKTTVYDALTWLLFGKDSHGNGEKNIDLKPLGADGQVADHEAITAVEAEFCVDERSIVLRRTLREVWSSRRGSSSLSYDGNTSEYFVDGVPVKKYAYDDAVSELVDEKVFRLLTSVSYFAQDMHWRDRREVLFRAAGTHSDQEILRSDDRFLALAEAAGNLPLDDYKKKLLAERKGYERAKTDIPARISENEGLLQQYAGEDYETARGKREAIATEKAALERAMAQAKAGSLAESRRNDLRAVQLELRELESRNREHRASQEKPDRAAQLARELDMSHLLADAARGTCGRLEGEREKLAKEIAGCREAWNRHNDMVFSPSACPTCGQELRGAALERARREFDTRVESGKVQALERANALKTRLADCEAELAQQSAKRKEAEDQANDLEEALERARAEEAVVEDLPEYASKKQELQERANELNRQIFELEADGSAKTSDLRGKIRAAERELSELDTFLARELLIPELQERISKLREEANRAASRLEKIDRFLFLLEEFTRYKTRYIEDGVNGLFRLAKFRLFREQANGGLEERCDVTFKGIPYGSLNNGARINVGIDIINTLSRVYGVEVPLFVDNAESVTRLEKMDTQVIRLVVSEPDKELRCLYED